MPTLASQIKPSPRQVCDTNYRLAIIEGIDNMVGTTIPAITDLRLQFHSFRQKFESFDEMKLYCDMCHYYRDFFI